jgi:hypothetical protein
MPSRRENCPSRKVSMNPIGVSRFLPVILERSLLTPSAASRRTRALTKKIAGMKNTLIAKDSRSTSTRMGETMLMKKCEGKIMEPYFP